MSRKRLTAQAIDDVEDVVFGQSSNDYWRDRAKNAVLGALSEVEKELRAQAQKITNEEAEILGVEPADYTSDQNTVCPAEEENKKMAMVFEPRKKEASQTKEFKPKDKSQKREAGAPVDATAIGKENWFQVQERFPQYSTQQNLTMLAVAPTKRNMEAVDALTDTLDQVASQLEENGNTEGATQLDVISDLLTASVQECQKILASKKKEQ
jgi:hypothetical protein